MSAIRQEGPINEHTTLIDVGAPDGPGVTAVYLIRGTRRSCLVDAGAGHQATHLVHALTELGAFPPDLILITHPHFDHAQGVPSLRQEASRQGKEIQVLASAEAMPCLANATFNEVFGPGSYESIHEVTLVEEGEGIDLGGITLRIYDIPGHCRGHVAILDERNGNIFVGDSLGYKIAGATFGYTMGDNLFWPPFMPPTWDYAAFRTSVNRLRQLPYETVSLAHFGCLGGPEAKSILDEAMANCDTWWRWYERHEDHLGDIDYLMRAIREEFIPGFPEAPIFLRWLAAGYSMYRHTHMGSGGHT